MPINQFVEKDDDNASQYRAYREKVRQKDIDTELRSFFNEPNKFAQFPKGVSAVSHLNNQQVPEVPVNEEEREAAEGSLFSRFVEDVTTGFLNSPMQAVGGVVDALNETAEFAEDVAPDFGPLDFALNIFDKEGALDVRFLAGEELRNAREKGEFSIIQFPTTDAPESVTGSLVRSSSQFITGFLFARGAVKDIKGIVPGRDKFSGFIEEALKDKSDFTKRLSRGLGIALEAEVAGAAATMVVFDPHEDRLSTFLNTVPGLSALVPDYLADNNPQNETQWEGRIKNAIEGATLGLFTESLFSIFRAYKGQRLNPELPPEQSINIRGEETGLKGNAPLVNETELPAAPETTAPKEPTPKERIQTSAREREEVIPDELAESLVNENSNDVFLEGDQIPKRIRDQLKLDEGAKEGAIPKEISEFAEAAEDLISDPLLEGKAISVEALVRFDQLVSSFSAATRLGGTKIATEAKKVEVRKFKQLAKEVRQILVDPSLMNAKFRIERLKDFAASAQFLKIASKPTSKALSNLDRAKLKLRIANNLSTTAPDIGNTVPRQSINIKMLDPENPVGDLMQKKINQNRELINLIKGGNKQTLKEWREGAPTRLRQLEDYLGRPAGFTDPEEVMAAGDILINSNQILLDRARIADSAHATPADLARFSEMDDFYNLLLSQFEASASREGRIFRSLREVRSKLGNRARTSRTNAGRQRDIEDSIARMGGTRNAKERARALIDTSNNPPAMNELVRKMNTPGRLDAIYEVWVNSILSGPHTHFRNIASNSSVSVLSIAESAWNAGISRVFFGGEIGFDEVAARALGLKEGMRDGFRLVAHGSQAEDVGHLNLEFDKQLQIEMVHPNAMSAKTFEADPDTAMGYGLDMMGRLINVPTNLLNNEDKFFKAIGYRMELKTIAIRKARSEGLEGAALNMRAEQLTFNTPEWLHMEAIDNAHYQTFTKPLGPLGQRAVDSIRNVPGGRFVLPFIRTPTNILKYSFERTPLVAFSKSFQDDIAAGGARAAQAWGRMSMGSSIMLAVAAMTQEGIITGPGPQDKDMARALRSTGWAPNSVRIGDKYIGVDKFDPIGNTVAWGAAIGEMINNLGQDDADFVVANATVAFSQNLVSQRYLRGLFDAIGAIDPSNPAKTPEGWLQRFLPSAIPYSSFLRSIARQIDPSVRVRRTAFGDPDLVPGIHPDVAVYMDDLLSGFRTTIPGLSSSLPLDRDQNGEEIKNPRHLFTGLDFLAPNWASIDKTDKVSKIIRENKIGFSRVPRKINGISLTGMEYSEYQRMAGEFYKDRVSKLVNSSGFAGLTDGPDGMKSLQIQGLVRKSRAFARREMINNFPNLRNRISTKRNTERAQLTGQTETDFTTGRPAFPMGSTDDAGASQSIKDQLGGK